MALAFKITVVPLRQPSGLEVCPGHPSEDLRPESTSLALTDFPLEQNLELNGVAQVEPWFLDITLCQRNCSLNNFSS